jgi:hypothetical protein
MCARRRQRLLEPAHDCDRPCLFHLANNSTGVVRFRSRRDWGCQFVAGQEQDSAQRGGGDRALQTCREKPSVTSLFFYLFST